jgi:hypothetical protein
MTAPRKPTSIRALLSRESVPATASEMTEARAIVVLEALSRERGDGPAHAAFHALLTDLSNWLVWSDGRYPDDSPGDVIAAEADGTIFLDDGITTWNPLRALAFLAGLDPEQQPPDDHVHPDIASGESRSLAEVEAELTDPQPTVSESVEAPHAPDCNCHECQPYEEWLSESVEALAEKVRPIREKREAAKQIVGKPGARHYARPTITLADIDTLLAALDALLARLAEANLWSGRSERSCSCSSPSSPSPVSSASRSSFLREGC